MNNKLYLSICIPTNGASHWVINNIESIYKQEYDASFYEVIITDNGKSDELEEKLKKYNYPNLRYIRTREEGFLNIITALKSGNGLFCRMLNHRSVLLPGVIQKWVEVIQKYQEEKPTIYFTDGVLGKYQYKECTNFETFVREMSYWSSWSAGIGIWDIDKPKLDIIKYNKMFPNTSILFETRQNGKYVIWNEKYQQMQDETGKGGYNIYRTFAVDYLDIINDLRLKERISLKTFIQIKTELYSFIQRWYDKLNFNRNKYTFETSNMDIYLNVYYSQRDIKSIKSVFPRRIWITLKKIFKRIIYKDSITAYLRKF